MCAQDTARSSAACTRARRWLSRCGVHVLARWCAACRCAACTPATLHATCTQRSPHHHLRAPPRRSSRAWTPCVWTSAACPSRSRSRRTCTTWAWRARWPGASAGRCRSLRTCRAPPCPRAGSSRSSATGTRSWCVAWLRGWWARLRVPLAVLAVLDAARVTRPPLRFLPLCTQDAVVKGWFRTSRDPTQGGTHLRVVALTAYEVASAMAYIHSHGIAHLVSRACAGRCPRACSWACRRLRPQGCALCMSTRARARSPCLASPCLASPRQPAMAAPRHAPDATGPVWWQRAADELPRQRARLHGARHRLWPGAQPGHQGAHSTGALRHGDTHGACC